MPGRLCWNSPGFQCSCLRYLKATISRKMGRLNAMLWRLWHNPGIHFNPMQISEGAGFNNDWNTVTLWFGDSNLYIFIRFASGNALLWTFCWTLGCHWFHVRSLTLISFGTNFNNDMKCFGDSAGHPATIPSSHMRSLTLIMFMRTARKKCYTLEIQLASWIFVDSCWCLWICFFRWGSEWQKSYVLETLLKLWMPWNTF